ncbi:OmpA family protein [Thalassospira lucentensis]|uniref:OmpA family protein n=1 Tax=Thalassospira lucentensis TaxID=168935 RepID=UPI002943335B|nr:OmpA family protein [Thalassospira lucentensis]WOI09945.1 OmpA family protein [Thalassospira lucentensis]
MKGYSKISVLAFMAALGGNAVVSGGASAQQYTPVSVDDSVQVNWDVADGIGGQPTVPNYLSPSVSREHISIAGSDLIYPETRPHSEFLAADRFAQDVSGTTYGDGFETVVIDGAGSNDIPTRSQFYGVPGVTTSPSYDDGANQVITLNRPEPAAAPRAKPAAPVAAAKTGSGSAPVPLSKPTPAPTQVPAPAAEMAQASESPAAPKAEPAPEAPKVETKPAEIEPPKAPPLPAEETRQAPPPPAPEPVIPDKSNVPEAPSPAPDTTTSPQEMLEQRSSNETPVAPAPAPEPAAEAAAVPPAAKDPVVSAPSGAGEYSLAFGSGSFELNNAARSQLDSIVKSMGSDENMRIQLQAYAEGDSNNASKARRLSLSRALQVRSYLIDKGVRSTRIDVRALGANVPSGPADRVDIKTVQR